MRQNTGAARGARVAVRLSREDRVRIDEAVKARGYTSPSAFIRAAIQNELSRRPELTETEDRIADGFERMSRDNLRIVRGQQALHQRPAVQVRRGRQWSHQAAAGRRAAQPVRDAAPELLRVPQIRPG